ncbi:MAG: glycosyltransferase family 2 protein [Chloroflexi bacterium]|nr:glycosyltransferase family 2 protein [Chloroflexota bacterium]
MTTLSVVIPAYNEEKGIAEIALRVLQVRPALAQAGVEDLELIVVDDGSRDQTAQVAAGLEGVTLVRHPKNRGYGAALKTGFAQARGELIGFLDADGTYPPEYFPQLCRSALDGGEMVVGSRMAGAKSKMPLTRRVGNIFFAGLLSVIGRERVTDSASGMRVFRREILERVYPLPDGLNLTPVMSTRAIHEKVHVVEVPIPYSERVGRSKLSVVRDGRIFLQSMVWTVLTYNPVRILGLIGLGGVGVAALVGLGLLAARLSGITSLGPWGVAALFWALVSGVGGISVFALGTTFNYLVSLFYDTPIRQGLFGKPIFTPSLDHYFGWIGLVVLLAGLGLGLASFFLGMSGWEIARLWLYLLGSAMFVLVGVQLMIYWILMRVLEELSQRSALAQKDLNGKL